MALTERTEIDQIEIAQQFYVQVRQATIVERDGQFVARTFHRWVLTPDSDISGQEQKVKDICNAAWTDEVKSAYEAFKAEQATRFGELA
jgi:TPP-dependent indolepyruvate ferredoxin oxidoreductase alpha subunit